MASDQEPTAAERTEVRAELGRLREFARSLRLDEVRDGNWFSRLVKLALDPYVAEVDLAYFAAAYPQMSPDAVVAARIERAARQALAEGGLSAGAYTGAVAATLGSAGTASPLTLPAAALSFTVDLLYVSQLQLRLAYDIAVVHRVPLDLDDPEDLWKLIRLAFAVKTGEAGRGAVSKGVPVLLRPVLARLYGSSAVAASRSLPLLGRHLLQRNVAKFTLPAVGVPLSMAVNYWSVRTAGTAAARVLRLEGAVVGAARRLAASTPLRAELLWVLWQVAKADGLVHENERLLLRHVTGLFSDPDSELAALAELARTGDGRRNRAWALLEAAEGDLAPLYEAGVVAAAVDGKINVNELTVLRRLAPSCGVTYDEVSVRVRAEDFRVRG